MRIEITSDNKLIKLEAENQAEKYQLHVIANELNHYKIQFENHVVGFNSSYLAFKIHQMNWKIKNDN